MGGGVSDGPAPLPHAETEPQAAVWNARRIAYTTLMTIGGVAGGYIGHSVGTEQQRVAVDNERAVATRSADEYADCAANVERVAFNRGDLKLTFREMGSMAREACNVPEPQVEFPQGANTLAGGQILSVEYNFDNTLVQLPSPALLRKLETDQRTVAANAKPDQTQIAREIALYGTLGILFGTLFSTSHALTTNLKTISKQRIDPPTSAKA